MAHLRCLATMASALALGSVVLTALPSQAHATVPPLPASAPVAGTAVAGAAVPATAPAPASAAAPATGQAGQSATGQSAAARSLAAAKRGVKGHDVSSHQGWVNWRRARANGARFVYVKATEGTGYRNPYFRQQYRGSRKAGILHGAYHFARPDRSSGRKQARYFTAHGGHWRNDGWTLPPALDLESAYGKTCHGLGQARMRQWIRSFSAETRRRTGRYPVIYTNARWWQRCTGGSAAFAANHPLWLADWDRSPGPLPAGWRFHTFWQHSDRGVLPGDQNRFNGSMAGLRRLARG